MGNRKGLPIFVGVKNMSKKINIHIICVVLAASFWGIAGIFVRNLEGVLEQMQMVFWRTVISALIFGVIIVFKDISLFKIRLKDLWLFVFAGLFSIVLFNYSYYTTMSLATLSVAAVLLYTAPFFVVIISLFLFKERMTVNKLLACVTAFIGCCFVSGLFDAKHKISSQALIFGLLTGFGYALYTIFGKLLMKRGYKTLTITFYVFLSAAVFSTPFINVSKTVKQSFDMPRVMLIVFLMALLNTVIPYILYTLGLSGVDPTVAPIIATVEPVVATLVGCFIFSEAISFYGVIGIILVLASVVLLNTKKITLRANAKINLTLDILSKREDGYHLIDTVMQSVTLYDTVMVSPSKHITVDCNIKDVKQEDNIAYKAAKLFAEENNIASGAKIKIIKRIPAAAGLGGGSADAAAVLLALNTIYKTELSEEKLCSIALKLGADVPFFIKGGTQRAEGIGEKLAEISHLKKGWFVLVKEGIKPSTAQMYKALDEKNSATDDTEKMIDALNNEDLRRIAESFGNAFISVWQETDIKEKLKALSANGVSLSGSGPTWFAFYERKTAALKAYRTLKKENKQCFIVNPCETAIMFE